MLAQVTSEIMAVFTAATPSVLVVPSKAALNVSQLASKLIYEITLTNELNHVVEGTSMQSSNRCAGERYPHKQ